MKRSTILTVLIILCLSVAIFATSPPDKPIIGGSKNTWGTILNTYLDFLNNDVNMAQVDINDLESDVADLQSDITDILAAGGVSDVNLTSIVRTYGTQTVAGDKTFSGTVTFLTTAPRVPAAAPTIANQVANKQYVDDQIAAVSSGSFGAWATKNVTTIYRAATDGFVLVQVHENFSSSDYCQILTDSGANPSTVRMKFASTYLSNTVSLICPVRKSDYYQVVIYGLNAANVTIYWLPMGT